MKDISIITGGAGGMGFAAAQIMGQNHHVIISDISSDNLNQAIEKLKQAGISCEGILCDISDRNAVISLAQHAKETGTVKSVIHTAGISPQMADPETILKVNALGTIYIVEEFFKLATPGFALINIASMAAHLMPGLLIPTKAFPLAESHPDKFLKKILRRCRLMPKDLYKTGLAYSVSKNFVIWYSKKKAAKFGEKGARILSVSPGTFDTQMGRIEEKSGSMKMLEKAALKRPGSPEEIAELLAFCASPKASYITGVDILCDGGMVASKV